MGWTAESRSTRLPALGASGHGPTTPRDTTPPCLKLALSLEMIQEMHMRVLLSAFVKKDDTT